MHRDFPANPVSRPGYVLEFQDEFTGPALVAGKWIAAHLPQWSSAERAAARWHVEDQQLVLRIDAD